MTTLKQILKEMSVYLDDNSPVISDKKASEYINDAMEIWESICEVCGKRCKNYKGKVIHRSKMHKIPKFEYLYELKK